MYLVDKQKSFTTCQEQLRFGFREDLLACRRIVSKPLYITNSLTNIQSDTPLLVPDNSTKRALLMLAIHLADHVKATLCSRMTRVNHKPIVVLPVPGPKSY